MQEDLIFKVHSLIQIVVLFSVENPHLHRQNYFFMHFDFSRKRNIKLVVSYFGCSYVGWQKAKPTHEARPSTPSIEETLEKSLAKVLQYPVKLQAASRTDADVHAEGQVVNFFMAKPYVSRTKKTGDTDLDKLKFILNCMLPRDIAIVSVEEAPIDFHPTLDSIKKEYWYSICNSSMQLPFHRNTSWHFPYPLDLDLMRKAALSLLGTHDFSAFCNAFKIADRNPICHLEKIEVSKLPQRQVRIAICGDRFLYKMARNIAGTLAYIGCGKLKPDSIVEILNNKDRQFAGITPPGFGLTLKKVYYPEKNSKVVSGLRLNPKAEQTLESFSAFASQEASDVIKK